MKWVKIGEFRQIGLPRYIRKRYKIDARLLLKSNIEVVCAPVMLGFGLASQVLALTLADAVELQYINNNIKLFKLLGLPMIAHH